MRKFLLFFLGTVLSTRCFPQSPADKQNNTFTPGATYKATNNNRNNLPPELFIYPNPAKNKITLQIKHFDPGMASVKLLDTKGKLVREDARLITNGTEDIIMFFMLKAGIYFILVSEPGKSARKKLVMF